MKLSKGVRMTKLNLTEREHLLLEAVVQDYIWQVWEKKRKTIFTEKAHTELRKLYEDKIQINPFKDWGTEDETKVGCVTISNVRR